MPVHWVFVTKCRLVNDPPKVSVSVLVNSLKGVFSRMIGQKQYPSVSKKRWGKALCSPSYFAPSCGGSDSDHRPIHRATANTRITNKQDTFGVRAIHPHT
jgi:REP element-mobilizing transposase RayT